MHLRSVPAILALCTLPVVGQFGNGGNGDIETSPLSINALFTLTVSGAPGQPFEIFVSDGPGPIVIGPFVVSLDVFSPAFATIFGGVIGPGGTSSLSVFVPNDPNLANFLVLYIQGYVIDPLHPTGIALTRGIRIDLETPDSFLPLPNLSAPRALGTGDALKDGRVLIAGGGNGTLLGPVATTTTEIYQPFSRSWSPGPAMSIERAFHTSSALNDGRILLCGGTSTSGVVTATCEIFDPATGTFSPAASMSVARAGHAATTLVDGRVLATGGVSTFAGTALGPILSSASNAGEVYDPVANTWAPVSNVMASKRFIHTQTRLGDGRVLCVSGINGFGTLFGVDYPTFTSSCSIYNPATNAFTAASAVPTARAGHRATLMPNGEVLVAGGVFSNFFVPTATNDSRVYTVGSNTWSGSILMPASVALQGQVLLKNGKAHVSGGGTGTLTSFSATEVCATRAVGGSWVTTAPMESGPMMPAPRGFHLAVRMHDGSVLISGGGDSVGAAIGTNLLYTPAP